MSNFTELCFYEYSFSKCNHMPNWNKIQERERGWMTSGLKKHYRNAFAKAEPQI